MHGKAGRFGAQRRNDGQEGADDGINVGVQMITTDFPCQGLGETPPYLLKQNV
jgi:hypothetical protein